MRMLIDIPDPIASLFTLNATAQIHKSSLIPQLPASRTKRVGGKKQSICKARGRRERERERDTMDWAFLKMA